MRWLSLMVVLAAACTEGNGDGPADDRVPQPLDDPYPYDSDCDGYEGTPVAGAMGWFVGEFEIDGNAVQGYEAWALIANDAWAETGEGYDCQMTWTIGGIIEAPINCPSCSYSMAIDANVNYELSDCHDRFIAAEDTPFSTTYNVRENPDGTTEVFFAESSRLLGTGTSDNNELTYRSDARCFFF